MIITIVKRPQEHPAMTHSRMSIALFAGLMSLSLAGAPAAFAQTTKDNMGKTDSMSKDSMSKDSGMKKDSMSKAQMSKDSMSKDKMKDNMSK